MNLRPYQQECINEIERRPPGAYLVQMATGLGKTVTFANIPRHGERMLILSHREELVEQPRKYFDCSYGVERAVHHSSGEDVVSASVQTISRRLQHFDPDEFDLIICDEAHHAAAGTYRKIFEHFSPRKLIGFTATPNRGDKVRLNDIFSEIIFQRDLRWGIENGYLCNITCKRVNIGVDLSKVRTRMGDFAPGELEQAMEGTADAIAQAYREHAVGPTLIFATSVYQCNEIASRIPGAWVVTGETKDRAHIIQGFTKGIIPCIVNCQVFTEGTDIPRVETVIIARPTQSEALYAQMVGRGLRLWPGKEKLTLIDCVGVTGRASLCTAPSLLGIDLSAVPARKQADLEGELFDLPIKAAAAADCPESWIRNVEIVDLWAQEQKYNLHDINFFRHPDGSLTVSLLNRDKITIPCPDSLGMTRWGDARCTMQQAIDFAFVRLNGEYGEQRYIWDVNKVKEWGNKPASENQIKYIRGFRQCREFDPSGLTKGQASQIINRLTAGRRSA